MGLDPSAEGTHNQIVEVVAAGHARFLPPSNPCLTVPGLAVCAGAAGRIQP
jgi:hypothetical protein